MKYKIILLSTILATFSLANELRISVPIVKKFIGLDNSNLDPISFDVNIEKLLLNKKNYEYGVGLGILKSPQIRYKKENYKMSGGDITYLPLYGYIKYSFKNVFYTKVNLGYSFVMDSNDIKEKHDETEMSIKFKPKNSTFAKVEIGYEFTNHSIFIFNQHYFSKNTIEDTKHSNINFTGVGVSFKF